MIEKISGVYGPKAIDKLNTKKGHPSPRGETATDGVEFSSFSVEMAKASAELKKIPEVREDLVNDLKRRIAGGTYSPDMKKVAHSLIAAGLMKLEE